MELFVREHMLGDSRAMDFETDRKLLTDFLHLVSSHAGCLAAKMVGDCDLENYHWKGRPAQHLTASNILARVSEHAGDDKPELYLLQSFANERSKLHWEQSYTESDRAVSTGMLQNYGFAEIIGRKGPFLSKQIRAGIGVFGSNLDYPPHRHLSQEIYIILSGSAKFSLDGDDLGLLKSGDVIEVPSNFYHGFEIGQEPLILAYIWTGGDLLQKSEFQT